MIESKQQIRIREISENGYEYNGTTLFYYHTKEEKKKFENKKKELKEEGYKIRIVLIDNNKCLFTKRIN